MSKTDFSDLSPLNYRVNSQSPVKRHISNRAPTSADFRNFSISDEWIKRNPEDTQEPYSFHVLVDLPKGAAVWLELGSHVVNSGLKALKGDDDFEVDPDSSDIVRISGGTNVATSGSGNTLTISATSDPHAILWQTDTSITSSTVLPGEGRMVNNISSAIAYTIGGTSSIGDIIALTSLGSFGFTLENSLGIVRVGKLEASPTQKITSTSIGDTLYLVCISVGGGDVSYAAYSIIGNFNLV
jgi:hypothetical protein